MIVTSSSIHTTEPPPSPSNLELFPGLITDPEGQDNHHRLIHHPNNQILVDAPAVNPRLPIGVIVALLMATGLVGNSLVLYVYHCKMPRTVFSTFVTVLALLDLLTVLISMPIDVVIKSVLLGGSSELNAICKVAHFEVYSSSLASGSVLLLIAVTRYSKVCRPMQPGLTKRQARLLCLLIALVAMVLCTVTFVINGMEKVRLKVGERDFHSDPSGNVSSSVINSTASTTTVVVSAPTTVPGDVGVPGGRNVLGEVAGNVSKLTEVVEVYICRTNEEHKGTGLYYALQAILMAAFVGIFVSLIILHRRISTAVGQFERRQSSMRRVSVHSGGEPQHLTHITASMFRIFATITVFFVVSYLPHLICLIVEKSLFAGSGEPMHKGARVVMDLAYNFPYINVVANPFIYGYRSAEFRRHCLYLLHRCCCRFCCCCCCRCCSRGRR